MVGSRRHVAGPGGRPRNLCCIDLAAVLAVETMESRCVTQKHVTDLIGSFQKSWCDREIMILLTVYC